MDSINIIKILPYIFIIIIIMIVIYKQKKITEKILLTFTFIMIGIITALGGVYIAVKLPKGEHVYLREPIIFSLFFISLLLILMLHNMYYMWREIGVLRNATIGWKRFMYNNRFFFFITSVVLVVLIVVCAYGFIYYIINNLPNHIASDLNGNFMDEGQRKRFMECVYFSGVTFFTVGYGDMIPKGVFFSIIVLLEMMTAYLLSIISIPILLSILIGKYQGNDIMRKKDIY